MSSVQKPFGVTVLVFRLTVNNASLLFFVVTYYDTYREQLTDLDRGHALWVPDPV